MACPCCNPYGECLLCKAMSPFPSPLPASPAARMELLQDLLAPPVFDEETGEMIGRDESAGLISREDFLRLLNL